MGHDNYKALAGSSTGSGAAAPLWQSYMSKIHSQKGLSNRDILEGDPTQYGLVKATTCAVSGQLATDACRNDAMGYGTVTDWWAQGTVPTVSCQMHVTQSVCADSGQPASPYCPSVVHKGVVTIPKGHPLYKFIGTQYESVLEEYLGAAAAYSGGVCSYHTSASSGGNSQMNSQLITDAQTLIAQAQGMLGAMDPSGAQYQSIQSAISSLQSVISSSSPSQGDIVSAMGLLTQAMAGLY